MQKAIKRNSTKQGQNLQSSIDKDNLLAQLQASLKEKEILLKEIHHRVKNNLQIISSLLSLQSIGVVDERAKDIFKESQNRIKSIALIHEKLYQSNNLGAVDFKAYIKSLCEHLCKSYNVDESRVKLKINIKDVSLNIDEVIPCGLIINELISNIFKYAFPNNMLGEVNINMFKNEDMNVLIVSDNGVGIPKNFDVEQAESLGLQLVHMLTKQLNGIVNIDREKGTTFEIKFLGIK